MMLYIAYAFFASFLVPVIASLVFRRLLLIRIVNQFRAHLLSKKISREDLNSLPFSNLQKVWAEGFPEERRQIDQLSVAVYFIFEGIGLLIIIYYPIF